MEGDRCELCGLTANEGGTPVLWCCHEHKRLVCMGCVSRHVSATVMRQSCWAPWADISDEEIANLQLMEQELR